MSLRDLLPSVRLVRISPDLRETNKLLLRIADALDRAIPIVDPADLATSVEDEPVMSPYFEEELAVVEMLEEAGRTVPDEVYKRLGLEKPPGKGPVNDDPEFGD